MLAAFAACDVSGPKEQRDAHKLGAVPGIEPGTSRTRSGNHTTRPNSQVRYQDTIEFNPTARCATAVSANASPAVPTRNAKPARIQFCLGEASASLAQLAEHALRKRMVMGSIPIGGFIAPKRTRTNAQCARPGQGEASPKNCLHFSICACHPCAGAMLIFSVSFQF